MKYYLKLILGHRLSPNIYSFTMTNMTFVLIGAIISLIIGFLYIKSEKGILPNVLIKIKKLNPNIFSRKTTSEEIFEMINKGEDEETEFKSTLRFNLYTNQIDKKIEYSVLKTISAFLNTKGGILLLGISDNGSIVGLEKDGFENKDKFFLHLVNLLKIKIGKSNLDFIDIQIISIENKTIAKIGCLKAKKPIFLKNSLGEEEFYIRAGPSTVQIKGSELIEYIKKRFDDK